MTIYRGVGGVNREIKQQFRGVGGVNREIKEQYRGVGGVNRKVFKKSVGGIDEHTIIMLHGDNFVDSSLNPKSGSYSGISIGSGYFGNGFISPNNGNDYPHVSFYNIALEFNFTVDFWFYIPSGVTRVGGVFAWGNILAEYAYGNALNIYMGSTNVVTIPINQGVWYHVALIKVNSIYCEVYLNGKRVLAHNNSSRAFEGSGTMCLFNENQYWGTPFYGSIDEFRVSDIVRWSTDFTPLTEPYSN